MLGLASPTRPPGVRQNVSGRVTARLRLAGGRATCRAAAVHDISMIDAPQKGAAFRVAGASWSAYVGLDFIPEGIPMDAIVRAIDVGYGNTST